MKTGACGVVAGMEPIGETCEDLFYPCYLREGNWMLQGRFNLRVVVITVIKFCLKNSEFPPGAACSTLPEGGAAMAFKPTTKHVRLMFPGSGGVAVSTSGTALATRVILVSQSSGSIIGPSADLLG